MEEVNMNYTRRELSRRSHLIFEFPSENNTIKKVYIPFLSNAKISENQKPNLGEYSLLGRANSLFSYAGSKSTNFSVSFNINLMHLINESSKEGLAEYFQLQYKEFNKSNEQDLFKLESFFVDNKSQNTDINHAKIHRDYYLRQSYSRDTTNPITPNPIGPNGLPRFPGYPITDAKGVPISGDEYSSTNKLINLYLFWANIIRCSTKNNSTNTSYGLPIIRLTHGPIYNNVPCIAQNYNIEINDDAGYDVHTLCPLQLDIKLDLAEVRMGDFGEYQVGKFIKGDNTTGWESVLKNNTLDPYNGLIQGKL
jgi:hypothetical protein